MTHLIDKDAVMAEIERKRNHEVQWMQRQGYTDYNMGLRDAYVDILSYIESLEVKEAKEHYADMIEVEAIEDGETYKDVSTKFDEAMDKNAPFHVWIGSNVETFEDYNDAEECFYDNESEYQYACIKNKFGEILLDNTKEE